MVVRDHLNKLSKLSLKHLSLVLSAKTAFLSIILSFWSNIAYMFDFIWFLLTEVDKSEPIKPTPPPPQSGFISGGNVLGIIATVGGALFICNLCLLYCYVKRRAGKHIFGEFLVRGLNVSLFQMPHPPMPGKLWQIVCWKRSRKFLSLLSRAFLSAGFSFS